MKEVYEQKQRSLSKPEHLSLFKGGKVLSRLGVTINKVLD
jgi:hypothetical protein